MTLSRSIAIIACCFTTQSAAADTNFETLAGTWESIACEVRPQPNQDGTMGEWWLTREVTFTDGRIEADFTTYAGPGCDFALQVLSFAGAVDIEGPSDVADGAVEAKLTIDEYVRFTPKAQGFADFLNQTGSDDCGVNDWKVDETQGILETGCSLLGIQANTPTIEYEILYVKDDQVFFGARPTDGSFIVSPAKRPKALLVPATKSEVKRKDPSA